jgi:hypothetical protein
MSKGAGMWDRRGGGGLEMFCLPSDGVPDTNGRVERTSDHPFPIESYRVNLVIMPLKHMQAFARIDIPHLMISFASGTGLEFRSSVNETHSACIIVAPGDDLISCHLDTPDTLLVADQRA